jgi:hypothetical protein
MTLALEGDEWSDGRIILEWFLDKKGVELRTGFMWLRINISGGLLSTWH